jgi:hypothetical protein
MPDDATVTMEVVRDGYWDGQYPRVGDLITVPFDLAAVFEVNGFAVRREADTPAATPSRLAKGSKHGR